MRMSYVFTIAKAKELQENNSLIIEEAKNLSKALEQQGNHKHSVEASANMAIAKSTEDMFEKVIEEYYTLQSV